MIALVIVETVILAILTVLVGGLLRAYGTVLARLHRLDGGDGGASGDTGSGGAAAGGGRTFTLTAREVPRRGDAATDSADFGPARDIAGETLTGELVQARVVEVEHDTVLLFLSSGCGSCAVFWDELRRPVPLPPRTRLLVVPQSPDQESVAALAEVVPTGVDVVLSSAAWRDYEVPGAPHAVLVDGPSGHIRGEGTGSSLRQIAELLARATGDARFVAFDAALPKSRRDLRDESRVDQALLEAGILPGDPRLYGEDVR